MIIIYLNYYYNLFIIYKSIFWINIKSIHVIFVSSTLVWISWAYCTTKHRRWVTIGPLANSWVIGLVQLISLKVKLCICKLRMTFFYISKSKRPCETSPIHGNHHRFVTSSSPLRLHMSHDCTAFCTQSFLLWTERCSIHKFSNVT